MRNGEGEWVNYWAGCYRRSFRTATVGIRMQDAVREITQRTLTYALLPNTSTLSTFHLQENNKKMVISYVIDPHVLNFDSCGQIKRNIGLKF